MGSPRELRPRVSGRLYCLWTTAVITALVPPAILLSERALVARGWPSAWPSVRGAPPGVHVIADPPAARALGVARHYNREVERPPPPSQPPVVMARESDDPLAVLGDPHGATPSAPPLQSAPPPPSGDTLPALPPSHDAEPLLAPGRLGSQLGGEPVGDELAIDAVYTWVNGSDPVWVAAAAPYFATGPRSAALSFAAANANKYRDWGELRYSMRSLLAYAPWVRTIYVVTAGPTQVPAWLNVSHPRIRVVHHDALFDDPAAQLPTFNSYAIESTLHRIPGLSNRFLYFNQDFLLARHVSPATWLQPAGPSVGPREVYSAFFESDGSIPVACRRPLEAAVADARAAATAAFVSCRAVHGGPSFWDTYVARETFRTAQTPAIAHVPHLWERRVMYAVEAALGARLAACRGNRLRNRTVDLNVHMQYESWRVAHERDAGEPAVRRLSGEHAAIALLGWPAFPPRSAFLFHIVTIGHGRKFYGALAEVMAVPEHERPLFVTLDDHLVGAADAVLAFHRAHLMAFFNTWWPAPAPWELSWDEPRGAASSTAAAAAAATDE